MRLANWREALAAEASNLFYDLPSLTPWTAEWFDYAVTLSRYRRVFGSYPNLRRPQTFSEKVIHKRLYDRRPLLRTVADKVSVRDYVASIVGADYLPALHALATDPEAIDWGALPARFVVKCSHGSGYNLVVTDKAAFDVDAAKATVRAWLRSSFYRYTREWCYRDLPRRVFVEEFLEGPGGTVPDDWKFFVYGGRAVYVQVDRGRFTDHRHSFYRRDRTPIDVRYLCDNLAEPPAFPANLEAMFALAERLGRDFDFVRVDLYNVGGRIVFGELTNYPNAGLMPFEPASVDLEFGSHWQLPSRRRTAQRGARRERSAADRKSTATYSATAATSQRSSVSGRDLTR